MGAVVRLGLLCASLVAGAALSGCSNDGEARADDQPVAARSSSASTPTPSTSARPTPTLHPLSRFEGDPAVQAARAWAVAAAQAINADQRDLARARPLMTATGQQTIPPLAAGEIGLHYPGPVPFTPTDVAHHGDRATVAVCFWSAGFGLQRSTGQPKEGRKIMPLRFSMVKVAGHWKMDRFLTSEADCSQVPVKGVGF